MKVTNELIDYVNAHIKKAARMDKQNNQGEEAIQDLWWHGKNLATVAKLIEEKATPLGGEFLERLVTYLEDQIEKTTPLKISCDHMYYFGFKTHCPERWEHSPDRFEEKPDCHDDIYHYFERGFDAVLGFLNTWWYANDVVLTAKATMSANREEVES